jgi:hypothetical protein
LEAEALNSSSPSSKSPPPSNNAVRANESVETKKNLPESSYFSTKNGSPTSQLLNVVSQKLSQLTHHEGQHLSYYDWSGDNISPSKLSFLII